MNMRFVLIAAAALPLALACGTSATSSSAGVAGRTGSAPSAGSGGTTASVGAGPSASTQSTLPQTAKIERQGRLTLEVPGSVFDRKVDGILGLVTEEGGFVAGYPSQPVPLDTASSAEGARTARIDFEVPTERFDDTIVRLRGLGHVTAMEVSGADVSSQYVDLEARLKNAQAQEAAYQALLARAQSIQDIIAIQNQLGQVNGQIEELEGQIAAIDRNTTYGTLSVTLRESSAAPVVGSPGLRQALADAAGNFTKVVGFMIVALGSLLPFLLLGGAGLAGWRLWMRRRRVTAPV